MTKRITHQYRSKVASKAGEALRLPLKPPPCWPQRQREWDQYRANCNLISGKGYTFCTDCTPERKEAMLKQGKCRYPKTTFVISHGVLVGRRRSGKKKDRN